MEAQCASSLALIITLTKASPHEIRQSSQGCHQSSCLLLLPLQNARFLWPSAVCILSCRACAMQHTNLQEKKSLLQRYLILWVLTKVLFHLLWVKVAYYLTCFGEVWFLFLLPWAVFCRITSFGILTSTNSTNLCRWSFFPSILPLSLPLLQTPSLAIRTIFSE